MESAEKVDVILLGDPVPLIPTVTIALHLHY